MTDILTVRAALVSHYRRHSRGLPWRGVSDPYAVWVSEVMLQQTRVDTVVPYYLRFLARFPTVTALAEAPVSDVLALWAGLGYYRRARMLHAGAQRVLTHHHGVVPCTYTDLRALPGIGEYTAGAIGSIAFALKVPAMDGNVERVLSRIHALHGDPRTPPVRRALKTLASAYADADPPGDVNQSLMELGATVCTPLTPHCTRCPVRTHCQAPARGAPTRFPEKPPPERPRNERRCAGIAQAPPARVWLTPRADGRWQGMLLPPLIPDPGRAGTRWLAHAVQPPGVLRKISFAGDVVHVLTHARMVVRVFTAAVTADVPTGMLYESAALSSLAVPAITWRLLETAGLRLVP